MQGTETNAGFAGEQRAAYLLGIAATLILIVLVFFKFLPDIGTAQVQSGVSNLVSWEQYAAVYLKPGSVHHARFLGNTIVHELALGVASWVSSTDPRLHPLRVSATLCTLFWFLLALAPVHLLKERLNWQVYLPALAVMFLAGQYIFYPCDAPSLAWLLLSLTFLLQEKLLAALVCMLITGLFRESAFHLVCMVGVWAFVASHQTMAKRLLWPVLFAVAFVVEYKAIRIWYPGDVRGMAFYQAMLLVHPEQIIFGNGFWSLTTLMTLPLAAMFPLACGLLKQAPKGDWRRRFFVINCWLFPAWLVFYRVQAGNLNEFRMLWPFLAPYLLGLAWRHAALPSSQNK
jgi:hypothetical protein